MFYFRSDVLGQFMPLVGKDWSQSGVARLFSAIKVIFFALVKCYTRCNDVLRWLSLTHHNPPFLGHGTRTECTSIIVVGKAFAFL